MSNIFTEAIANCDSIPSNEDTTKILTFFTNFIKEYGVFLKEDGMLRFKFLITGISCLKGFKVVLTPFERSYGTFSAEFENTPFGRIGLANLLRYYGAKVTYDTRASQSDEIYEHYLVEFTINE